jgi:nucleoside-diphosphate-sugar epimerase
MKAFITGASGFIGRALSSRLAAEGWEVAGIDLLDGHDISQPGPWQDAAAGSDVVIHTAAVVSMRGDDPRAVWRVNALGTANVLAAARRAGAGRFVHLSSVTVFGFAFPDGVDESYPCEPNGVPYVDTKIASEALVLRAHAAGEVPCTVIRPGDVYGPGSRPWTLLPLEELKRNRFILPARGRGVFSPVYIDNLVDGIVAAAQAPAASGGVFTLSDGAGVTTAEFFGHYARLLDRRLPTLPTAVAVRLASIASLAARGHTEIKASSARYLACTGTYNISRARQTFSYAPTIPLTEGMARTAAWLRAEHLV